MRIHNDARCQAKDGSQDYIGRLSPNPRQLHHFFHRLRDLAMVILDKRLAKTAQRFRLVMKKACRPDVVFQLLQRNRQVILRSAIFLEKRLCHRVHSLVRALSRENGRDEKLERGNVT